LAIQMVIREGGKAGGTVRGIVCVATEKGGKGYHWKFQGSIKKRGKEQLGSLNTKLPRNRGGRKREGGKRQKFLLVAREGGRRKFLQRKSRGGQRGKG